MNNFALLTFTPATDATHPAVDDADSNAGAPMAHAAPEDGGDEEMKNQESANSAKLTETEQGRSPGTEEMLLGGVSARAVDAALPPGADGGEADEPDQPTNHQQRLAPPIADDDAVNGDELVLNGEKVLVGWDELLVEAAKPADLVFGSMEAETLAIISGEPGRGKSLLVTTQAVAAAGGVPFGGIAPPCPQSAVIFSPEDKLSVIGARIKAAVEELSADPAVVARNLRVVRVPESSVIFEGVGESLDFNPLGRMLRKVIQARRARFVALDPFIELHTADENSNMQIHGLLSKLRTLARETRSLIVLTHHSAKGGQGPRGAGAFLGTVRASLHVDGLGKEEVNAAKAKGLRPASIFKVVSIKNSYGGDLDGGTYFQKVAIREGEAPVLRRVELEMDEAGGK